MSKSRAKRGDVCADCESRWTGTHYAKQPVAEGGDAMEKRIPGSFEGGKQ
jgi:hypothetical protein